MRKKSKRCRNDKKKENQLENRFKRLGNKIQEKGIVRFSSTYVTVKL